MWEGGHLSFQKFTLRPFPSRQWRRQWRFWFTWFQFLHMPLLKSEPIRSWDIRGMTEEPHLYLARIILTQRSSFLLQICHSAFMRYTWFIDCHRIESQPPNFLGVQIFSQEIGWILCASSVSSQIKSIHIMSTSSQICIGTIVDCIA